MRKAIVGHQNARPFTRRRGLFAIVYFVMIVSRWNEVDITRVLADSEQFNRKRI